MRISELAERTGVSVATVKFYVREGLLHPGESTSRTTATYDERHVERVALIRALTGVGGLSLAAARAVIAVAADPHATRIDAMHASAVARDEAWSAPAPDGRAAGWLARRGWIVEPDDPVLAWLDAAWQAVDDAGLAPLDESRMDAYADLVEPIADLDLRAVPTDPSGAVREVVVGTVLTDQVLLALRRLAQQDNARRRAGEKPTRS